MFWSGLFALKGYSSDSLWFGNLSCQSPPGHMQLIRFTIFITPCSFCCSQLCQQPDSCQCFPSERPAPRRALMAGGRATGEDKDWGNIPLQTSSWQGNTWLSKSVSISQQPSSAHETHAWQGKTFREKAVLSVPGTLRDGWRAMGMVLSGQMSLRSRVLPAVSTSFLLGGTVHSHSKGVFHFHIQSCLVLGSWGLLLNSGPKI